MNCYDYLEQVNHQYKEVFESQDPELFDVVFEIEGKKLYTDKLRLSLVSPTFKSMLSNQWHRNKNEPIQISGYKYEDFNEFLKFIYSGCCNFNEKNILTMLDMSEFYQIPHLKQLCDENLSQNYNFGDCYETIIHLIETSNKYSLSKTKKMLKKTVNKNFNDIINLDDFLNSSRSNIIPFFEFIETAECVFLAGYRWAAYQAFQKHQISISTDCNPDLNELIKVEIMEFLPFVDLKKMKKRFLLEHIVDNAFIFTTNEDIEFLQNFNPHATVKITNSHGQSISAVTFIGTTRCKVPTIPNLVKRDGVEWYLIYFADGDIGAKHFSWINDDGDYLLAEMVADNEENGFVSTTGCKIEIDE